jgi:hypothetical protein
MIMISTLIFFPMIRVLEDSTDLIVDVLKSQIIVTVEFQRILKSIPATVAVGDVKPYMS